ncbi:cysteine peptidase family C39 domain-containing protein [uncultured Thiothrix sp.]|uniref:cysteine peptidase family C39 domain-containing protein n=1 Tax=uncultured Thiothrix sp. TaxID=223185 RepID=UPI002628D763|nr:cysteine peptidase family C39 domain-containing protein [uncultured Thiothrix sp.]
MFNYICTVLIAVVLTACVSQQQAKQLEPNYVAQGLNVTECGPASAAMLVNFAGGKSSVAEARKLTKHAGLWTLDDIEHHLANKSIPFKVLTGFSIAEALQDKAAVAALTNIGIANHFVVAYELRGGLVRVADPLFGMRWDSVRSFDQRATPIFIKVERK